MTAPVVDAVDAEAASFFKREPVLLLHAFASVAGYAATSIGLDRSGADRVTNLVVPAAVTFALMLQGFVIRRFVTPAWKKLQNLAAGSGVNVPDLPPVPDLTADEAAALAALLETPAA